MYRFRLILVSMLITVAGCTQTRVLTLSSQNSRNEVNAQAAGRTATLVLQDGFDQNVWGIHIAPDNTTWIDPETDELRSIPTSEVEAVRFISRGRGTLLGYGAGWALTTILEVVYHAATGRKVANGLLVGTLFTGPIVGGTLGGVTGAVRGSRTVYRASPIPAVN